MTDFDTFHPSRDHRAKSSGDVNLTMVDVGAIGDVAVVRITEQIDMTSGPRLEHVLRTVELMGRGNLILSLEDCVYCDSTCLAIVLRAVRRIGSRLRVVVPPGTRSWRIFEITGIADEPFVFLSLDEAVAAS